MKATERYRNIERRPD